MELGVLPIQVEIEKKQLMFLKHLFEKSESNPALKLYQQMVKYQFEMNLVNFVLNQQNIKVMSKDQWRSFVNEKIRSYAFDTIVIQCQLNSKTNHFNYKKFCQQLYITKSDPQIARIIFKARTRMFDVKTNVKTKCNAYFAKLLKNPWNIFLYVQMVLYVNLVIMFLAIWSTL